MGVFTIHEDKRVDEVIKNDLRHASERIKASIPTCSIVLGGGFGRGEGSVLISAEKVQPVNDYDIFVVVPDGFEKDLRPLSKEIAQEIGIRYVDIILLKRSELKFLPPTQFNYDLKYGGLLLWGEDALNLMPAYEEGRIDRGAARTLLLNRLICAIEAYSVLFEYRSMTRDQKFFLVNQTGKVISACVESLLIIAGQYHHRCRVRQEIFEKIYPDKYELASLNRTSTAFKLSPTEEPDIDSVSYWKNAMSEYIKVISDELAPGGAQPYLRLWNKLKWRNSKRFTNTEVERVELILLASREAPMLRRWLMLLKARSLLRRVTKEKAPDTWEGLRGYTSELWHRLYH